MRIGIGLDVHRFVKGRKLFLGGVEIPHSEGLEGHSDADALIHAVVDAVLGALGEGDIGRHFPDTDMKYKDIASVFFLDKARELLKEKRYAVSNIDTVIAAQAPKITPFAAKMAETIARHLGIDKGKVSIKATTTEGLGFTGRKEGLAAHAVVLLEEI